VGRARAQNGAALSVGAWGYVVKATAGSELPAAVDAGISGKKFVSSK